MDEEVVEAEPRRLVAETRRVLVREGFLAPASGLDGNIWKVVQARSAARPGARYMAPAMETWTPSLNSSSGTRPR
ncbi:MAG: hypothetical protein PVH29_10965 [Candidatus Zixiibacteriota bacterium]